MRTPARTTTRSALPHILLAAALSAVATVPAPVAAQATTIAASAPFAPPPPPRPRLAADADTNDAEPYLAVARAQLGRDSQRSAAAAYWATRIDPTSAPALLVRWLAESEAARWKHMGPVERAEKQRIDSLVFRSMARDPFANPDEAVNARYGPLLSRVRKEIDRHPEAIALRFYLASRYFAHQHYDSTVAELRRTLDVLDRIDREHLSGAYQSREMVHFAIAKALYAASRRDEARDEYAAALGENVAFYPAHAELGSIAWTQWNDLARAREEFGLALELHDDALVRYDYGTVLLLAGHPDEAVAQFDRAIALEPYFANAYANRAIALDRLGRREDARAAYEAFLARAPLRLGATAAAARERLRALSTAAPPADSTAAARPPR